jgi:PAS domain-containing protein
MSPKPTYEELEQKIEDLELIAIQRIELNEKLRKSDELFEKTFISQRDAIFILDSEIPPKIIDCNPATERTFGYTRQEMLERPTFFCISTNPH